MNFNRVFLYGNLARDPETRHTQSGSQVTNFTIGVNDRKAAGKEDAPPMFIKIEAWNKTAELAANYLKKGSAVLVEGRLKLEEYETKDGQKRRDPVVVADNIQFGPKSTGQGGDYAPREQSQSYSSPAPARAASPAPQQRRQAPPPQEDYGSTGPSQEEFSGGNGGGGGTEDDLPF